MKLHSNSELVFSSGHTASAYGGVVGLDAFGTVPATFQGGWDDCTEVGNDFVKLTPADCTELADHMIARWTAWREMHGAKA